MDAVDRFIAAVFQNGWHVQACEHGTPPEIVTAFWVMVGERSDLPSMVHG